MADIVNEIEHRRFSRQRVLRAAKTSIWVLCITVLIWVYADLEKTVTEEIRGRLVLRLGAGEKLAFLGGAEMDRQDIEVTFTASCGRGGLDRCRREMAANPESLSVDLSSYEPGEHQLQAADLLRRTSAVRGPGLTIVSASPAVLTVRLDRTVRVPDVEVKYPDPAVEAAVYPPRMAITVAASVWKKLKEAAKPREPVLKTKPALSGAEAEANRPLRVEVVPFISGEPVAPERPVVDVVLKVSQAMDEVKLNVPLRVQVPPSWAEDDTWQKFILKREDATGWQKEITFRGPKMEIEKLRPENVDAYLPLSDNDKPSRPDEAPHKGTVEVRLPRDSQIQVVGEKPTILFRLVPRPAATPPP